MHRFWIAVLLGLLPLAARAEDAEERQLSAELLEVSSGDFEKARAAFKAIADDEKASEAVRSKALLGLSRCQRKLGQLEAAKKTLDDLVKAPAKDPEILRQAKSYLRELTGGRPENPDFDWVREIEKNPEIQARVFEWAMQLVGLDRNTTNHRASRQLLALGSIALPVVERVLDASRDPVHRQDLALIAARSGRIERLAVLLDPAEPAQLDYIRISTGIEEICTRLPGASAEERKKVLDLLATVPRSPRTDAVRSVLEIAAGDTRDLAQKLQAIEKSPLFGRRLLSDLLDREPMAAETVAAPIRDKSRRLATRLEYFDCLLEKAPAKLTVDDGTIVEETATEGLQRQDYGWRVREYVKRLEELGRFDVLRQLAAGNAWRQIDEWFETRYVEANKLHEAAGAWGAVLRQPGKREHKYFNLLHRLAEANDEAAVEFASFLRARSVEAPDFKPTREYHDPNWTPSPKYAELMAGLLDVQDQTVLALALEALALAPPRAEPDILPVLERLVLSPSTGKDVRAPALKILLRHLAARPERAPAIATLFRNAVRIFKDDLEGNGFQAAVQARPPPALLELFRRLLAIDIDPTDASWLSWLFGNLPLDEGWKIYLEYFPKFDTSAKRAMLIGSVNFSPVTTSPAGLEFFKMIAMDSSLTPDVRFNAVQSAGEVGRSWLDWLKLAEADDRIVEQESNPNLQAWLLQRPRAEQDRFLDALAKSKSPTLRKSRLHIYPPDRPEYSDVLLKALDDPSEMVQEADVEYLLNVEKLQTPALYTRLLEHPAARRMTSLYKLVIASGDSQLIEPLVKLLDERDPKVRTLALGALKSIRESLAEKKEWQAILQAAKERKKE